MGVISILHDWTLSHLRLLRLLSKQKLRDEASIPGGSTLLPQK